jgi:hypothetical protein
LLEGLAIVALLSVLAGCGLDPTGLGKQTSTKQSLFTPEEYRTLVFPNLRSDLGLEVNALVWSEIITELKKAVPVLGELRGT